MRKEMCNITVYTSDQVYICISGEYSPGEVDTVNVSPDQVDVLIKWLQEAANELTNNQD